MGLFASLVFVITVRGCVLAETSRVGEGCCLQAWLCSAGVALLSGFNRVASNPTNWTSRASFRVSQLRSCGVLI